MAPWPRLEPGPPDPEHSALTIRPPRPVETCCKDNIEETEETADGSEGIKLHKENIEPNIPSSSSLCEVTVATATKCMQKVCVKGKPHNIL